MIDGWRVAQPYGFELGEHPVWDERTDTLWCVDAYGGAVVGVSGAAEPRRLQLGSLVGAMALRHDGGIVALVDDAIGFFDLEGRVDADPISIELAEGTRFNDAACDPAGRLLFGTASIDGRSASAQLLQLGTGGVVTCLEGLVESNGLAWSADGGTLYFIDSIEPVIRRYSYDVESGALGPRLADLARTDDSPGAPDGLTIDREGALWVAIWEGGEVRRYSAEGDLLARFATPTSRPTCGGFGGADLTELFVASGWEGLDEAGRAWEPHSGDLLARRVDVPGLPAPRLGPVTR